MWRQWLITLDAKPRGFHLVTRELLDPLAALSECRTGLLHRFIPGTSIHCSRPLA